MRPKCLQITMLLTFKLFGRARSHIKKFPKYGQTSFSGIFNWEMDVSETTCYPLQPVQDLFSDTFCCFQFRQCPAPCPAPIKEWSWLVHLILGSLWSTSCCACIQVDLADYSSDPVQHGKLDEFDFRRAA